MVFEFLKRKKEIKIPAPPSAEELPSFPTPKAVSKPSPKELKEAAGVKTKSPLEEHKENIVRKERKSLEEMEEHRTRKPIFVYSHDYKRMVDEIGQIKVKVNDGEEIINTIENFRTDEEVAFKKWHSIVKDIHEKLVYMDEILFVKR